jgi:hypothetical protein
MAAALHVAEVAAVRSRIARAHALAAARFREAFVAGEAHPEVLHLEIQAAALLECAERVRLRGAIRYELADRLATPYVERGKPLFPYFDVERTSVGVFEYWLVISEILASPAWHVTKLLAEPGEVDDALRRMESPQIVRAIPPPLLPSVDLRDDGTALLDVTVYTRAGEERIERRTLALDRENEFRFHGRVLIAEGRGGVAV